MQRIEVNVLTGEQTVVDLTAEEIAEAHAQAEEWRTQEAQRIQTPTLEQTIQEQQTLIAALTARLTALENRQ
jgi:hypothetical protein